MGRIVMVLVDSINFRIIFIQFIKRNGSIAVLIDKFKSAFSLLLSNLNRIATYLFQKSCKFLVIKTTLTLIKLMKNTPKSKFIGENYFV